MLPVRATKVTVEGVAASLLERDRLPNKSRPAIMFY